MKYIPKSCYSGKTPDKFYQYTIIDEASRERFLFQHKEQSSYSTVDFIKRAILYFGYPVDILLNSLNIKHQLIRPRTPRHNGKVERSHRNDGERFYKFLSFYS